MKRNKSTFFLIAASANAVCSTIFAVALARYIGRLPDDWVGIGLYSAAVLGFAIAAFGFYIQWRTAKELEKKHRLADPAE
jgi:protein-S-isoprenylcysteine O-methyltransferase Ste14